MRPVMLRTNPHRIHLYLLRPGARGEFQSLGSANGFFPSLWQVLLAETPSWTLRSGWPGDRIDGQINEATGQWQVADARRALSRLKQFIALIVRHPQFHEVAGLDRYLDAAQVFLQDAIAKWESPGADGPLLCIDIARMPLSAHGSSPDHHVAELNAFREQLAEVIRTDDFAAIETLLRFPSRNLRFTDWKAWSGMFGLAQFEPHYFMAAFREPFAEDYADHDYDEFGSEARLGYDCYRFREGAFWGICREAEDDAVVVLDPVWDRIFKTGEGERSLVWTRREGRYGLVDLTTETATVLREPDLDEVHGFQDAVAIVRVDARFGLLDVTGKWRLRPCFDEIHAFVNALAVVRLGTKFGYIDDTGTTVIEPQFDEADDFHIAGVTRVRQGPFCGLIRRDGSIALPLHFTSVEWSHELSGWLCKTAHTVLLAHADGGIWVDGAFDAIELLLRDVLLRVRRGASVGLLDWSGATVLPCEFESLTLSDIRAVGTHSAQWKGPQLRTSRGRRAATESSAEERRDIVARRDGRVGLLDWRGEMLVPFEFSYIDALEPQVEEAVQLTTPDLIRVVSVPGTAAPRVGVWSIEQRRCIVPCQYDFVWSALFAADGAYGFIVANRNPKRGSSALGRYRVGLLDADGNALVPQEYAWIAESTLLNRVDAAKDIRSTLFYNWSRGELVRASLGANGPLVGLNMAGQQCELSGDALSMSGMKVNGE